MTLSSIHSYALAGAQNTFNLLRNDLDYNVVGKIDLSQPMFHDHRIFSLPIDLLSQTSSDETPQLNAVINARKLYRSCINESAIDSEGVDYILSLVNSEFGGWPILQGSVWNNESFSLIDLIIKLRQYNQNLLFRVLTATDDKNSTSYDIEVSDTTHRSHRIAPTILAGPR